MQGFARHVTVSRRVSSSVTVHLIGIGLMIGWITATVVGTGIVFVFTHARVTVSTMVSVMVSGPHGFLWHCICGSRRNLSLVCVNVHIAGAFFVTVTALVITHGYGTFFGMYLVIVVVSGFAGQGRLRHGTGKR
jgi:hypothetical protein